MNMWNGHIPLNDESISSTVRFPDDEKFSMQFYIFSNHSRIATSVSNALCCDLVSFVIKSDGNHQNLQSFFRH